VMLRKVFIVFVGVAVSVALIELVIGAGVHKALSVALYGALGATIGYAALLQYQGKRER
jgi:hypothetical protein